MARAAGLLPAHSAAALCAPLRRASSRLKASSFKKLTGVGAERKEPTAFELLENGSPSTSRKVAEMKKHPVLALAAAAVVLVAGALTAFAGVGTAQPTAAQPTVGGTAAVGATATAKIDLPVPTKTLTLKATVMTGSGKPIVGETVSFFLNLPGKAYGYAKTDENGVAVVKYEYVPRAPLRLIVDYMGDKKRATVDSDAESVEFVFVDAYRK